LQQRIIEDLVIECGMAPQSYFWEWDHWAQSQFRLVAAQLKAPRDGNFLDIGCGAMRLGYLLVPYLEDDRYCGIDPLQPYVDFAHRLMDTIKCGKTYQLHCSGDFDFEHFGRKFDFAFAHSVLGHLSEKENRICFANLKKVMKPGAKFYATIALAGAETKKASVGFFYNGTHPFRRPLFKDLKFLESLCEEVGVKLEKRPADPGGQELIEVTF
jgi:SAM-dependent methyltransferase